MLTIDTTDLNFIKHETDLDLIETQVRDAFKNMLQQSELPMNIDQNVGN